MGEPKWRPNEDEQLIRAWLAGIHVKTISKRIGRSERGARDRAIKRLKLPKRHVKRRAWVEFGLKLEPETYQALKRLAHEACVPFTVYLRHTLNHHIREHA